LNQQKTGDEQKMRGACCMMMYLVEILVKKEQAAKNKVFDGAIPAKKRCQD